MHAGGSCCGGAHTSAETRDFVPHHERKATPSQSGRQSPDQGSNQRVLVSPFLRFFLDRCFYITITCAPYTWYLASGTSQLIQGAALFFHSLSYYVARGFPTKKGFVDPKLYANVLLASRLSRYLPMFTRLCFIKMFSLHSQSDPVARKTLILTLIIFSLFSFMEPRSVYIEGPIELFKPTVCRVGTQAKFFKINSLYDQEASAPVPHEHHHQASAPVPHKHHHCCAHHTQSSLKPVAQLPAISCFTLLYRTLMGEGNLISLRTYELLRSTNRELSVHHVYTLSARYLFQFFSILWLVTYVFPVYADPEVVNFGVGDFSAFAFYTTEEGLISPLSPIFINFLLPFIDSSLWSWYQNRSCDPMTAYRELWTLLKGGAGDLPSGLTVANLSPYLILVMLFPIGTLLLKYLRSIPLVGPTSLVGNLLLKLSPTLVVKDGSQHLDLWGLPVLSYVLYKSIRTYAQTDGTREDLLLKVGQMLNRASTLLIPVFVSAVYTWHVATDPEDREDYAPSVMAYRLLHILWRESFMLSGFMNYFEKSFRIGTFTAGSAEALLPMFLLSSIIGQPVNIKMSTEGPMKNLKQAIDHDRLILKQDRDELVKGIQIPHSMLRGMLMQAQVMLVKSFAQKLGITLLRAPERPWCRCALLLGSWLTWHTVHMCIKTDLFLFETETDTDFLTASRAFFIAILFDFCKLLLGRWLGAAALVGALISGLSLLTLPLTASRVDADALAKETALRSYIDETSGYSDLLVWTLHGLVVLFGLKNAAEVDAEEKL